MAEELNESTEQAADASSSGSRQERVVSDCGCKYQKQDTWGYQVWVALDKPPFWKPILIGSIDEVREQLVMVDKPVLVKCRGCGDERLREYR